MLCVRLVKGQTSVKLWMSALDLQIFRWIRKWIKNEFKYCDISNLQLLDLLKYCSFIMYKLYASITVAKQYLIFFFFCTF